MTQTTIHEMIQEVKDAEFKATVTEFVKEVHAHNVAVGWWTNLKTGEPIGDEAITEKLCLVHSEISEAVEGWRKDLMDDKLPHRKMIEVELADAWIRIGDIAGKLNLDLGGAIIEKRAYNAVREDHKVESRRKGDGKKF